MPRLRRPATNTDVRLIEQVVEVNLMSYASSHGVDRGGGAASDSTPGFKAATADLSAEMAALTTSTGIRHVGRLIVPKGMYNLKKAIYPAPYVRWELDEATLIKGADAVAPGSDIDTNWLIAAPELQVLGNYYGRFTGFQINGGYLSSGGHTAWGSLVRMLWLEEAQINYVTWLDYAPPAVGSPFTGSWALNFGGNDNLITSPRIIGGANVNDDGIHLVHGKDNRIISPNIDSGDDMVAVGGISTASLLAQPDPIERVTISNITGVSQRGHALRVHAEPGVNQPVSQVVVNGITARAGVLRNGGIYVCDEDNPAIGSEIINGVTVEGVDLKVGSTNHDEVNLIGVHVRSAKNVSIKGRIDLTDDATPTTGGRLVYAREADNASFDISTDLVPLRMAYDVANTKNLKIKGKLPSPASLVASASVLLGTNTEDTRVEAEILNVPNTKNGIEATSGGTSNLIVGGRIEHAAGATSGIGVRAGNMNKVEFLPGLEIQSPEPWRQSDVRAIADARIPAHSIGPGASPSAYGFTMFEDFRGSVVPDGWPTFEGTDAATAVAIPGGTAGIIRLTTGADAAGTMATNGVRLESSRNLIRTRGMSFETRLSLDDITDAAVWVGLTNQYGSLLANPFTSAAGDVWTPNAGLTDAVGFGFDTAGDTDNWWLTGRAASVNATAQNSGVAPVASGTTFVVLRVEVTSTGDANFFINGAKVGTTMTGAVGSAIVGPVVSVFSRTNDSFVTDVDYIDARQPR